MIYSAYTSIDGGDSPNEGRKKINGQFEYLYSRSLSGSTSGSTDTFITGTKFDNNTFTLALYRNDGVGLSTDLSILANDVYVLSGVYSPSDGTVTYTNSTGGTFEVSGFTTGITDSFVTGGTVNGNNLTLGLNNGTSANTIDLSQYESYWTSGSTGNNSITTVGNKSTGGDSTGLYSTASGYATTASGNYSTASGYHTNASGMGAVSEGDNCTASGGYSHAEGSHTIASNTLSHSEGGLTEASGSNSHSGGRGNNNYKLLADGEGSFNHSRQQSTTIQYGAYGDYSAILGGIDNKTDAAAIYSVVLGGSGLTATEANRVYVEKFNIKTLSGGASINNLGIDINGNVVVGTTGDTDTNTFVTGGTVNGNNLTLGLNNGTSANSIDLSQYESYWVAGTGANSGTAITTIANKLSGGNATGKYSKANGYNTTASGNYSEAMNYGTTASGDYSTASGYYSTASNISSNAEGYGTTASAIGSHSEGVGTTANADGSHAEGNSTIAHADSSHAEGHSTYANGAASHSEGSNTTAQGDNSHATGSFTTAFGRCSYAGGQGNYSIKLLASGDISFNHSKQESTTIQYGVYSDYSAILGGTDNLLTSGATNSVLLGGQNLTGNSANTVYVPYLNINNLNTGTSVNNLGVDNDGNVVANPHKYTTTSAFTANTPLTITHNLNDSDIIVQVINNNELIIPDTVSGYTNNDVSITVSISDNYKVIIIK